MDGLLMPLKSAATHKGIIIDNPVFRLHYRVTVLFLLAFSILVTARQFIGDPIHCIPTAKVPEPLLDTFCWIHATFSVEEAWGKAVGDEVPYPGVDNYIPGRKRVFHRYYQWVCFVLFLQALLFYTPRYLWKHWEGSCIRSIILELDSAILNEDKKTTNLKLLVDYVIAHFYCNNAYFFAYTFCELLNLANVFGQMYLIDHFLGGEFSAYGVQVLEFSAWDPDIRYDPMVRVFPRVTKCSFHGYGPSGDVQRYDTLCILPVNVLNEKIYIFLWFWFIIIALLSLVTLLYRLFLLFLPPLRLLVLKPRARMTNAHSLASVVNKCKIGDWFLLQLLCKNMDSLNYGDFITDLSRRMGERKREEN